MTLKISNFCFILLVKLQVSSHKISISQTMRRNQTSPGPSPPKFINENGSKVSHEFVRCWLPIGQHTLFALKIIGEIPSSCTSCSLIWRRHDNMHLRHIIQVRGFPKYCSLVIKSLSEIMLRNGFRSFDDHRFTKPILNWFIFFNRKIIYKLSSIQPKLHVTSPLNGSAVVICSALWRQ